MADTIDVKLVLELSQPNISQKNIQSAKQLAKAHNYS